VQPQTRILMRSLKRLRIPALLFVNKVDRGGARPGGVLDEISRRLKVAVIAMGRVDAAATRGARVITPGADDAGFTARLAELLAERDDGLLAEYLRGEAGVPYGRLRAALAAQTGRAQVHPVFFGSAMTGAGIGPLMAGLAELLPASAGDADGPVSGRIFKIERGGSAEKIAFVRMFSGTVRIRDRLRFGAGLEGRVTAVAVFERGSAVRRPSVRAGQIARLHGLAGARVGDPVGQLARGDPVGQLARGDPVGQFPPPTLESAVVPCDPGDRHRLRAALGQLAEQDPLINLRQDDERQEIYISLYGEVQKQVIGSVLAEDYGLAVTFRETTTIYIERPAGTVVCEPMASVRVELPAARTGAVLSCLARLGADVDPPLSRGDLSIVLTTLPSAKVRSLQEQLPGLTGGEGVLEAGFGGYRPVHGRVPSR